MKRSDFVILIQSSQCTLILTSILLTGGILSYFGGKTCRSGMVASRVGSLRVQRGVQGLRRLDVKAYPLPFSRRAGKGGGFVRALRVYAEGGDYTVNRPDGFQEVLFVECGMGCDQHGQNVTKAAVRACRNAIEFNSLPALRRLIPGGKANMKLHLQLGVPVDPKGLDLDQVRKVFPYGQMQPIQLTDVLNDRLPLEMDFLFFFE
ncbi:hypothetical protein AAMO2058_001321200 [Amorphochlora amoebiformis]